MRQRSAGKLYVSTLFVSRLCVVKLCVLFLAVVTIGASGSQIQAFKNAPARPATAAQQVAKEQQSELHSDTPEARTEKALNEARGNNGALYALLREMPKGGDLHNHISGAVYAENLVQFAADSGLCIDRQSLALEQAPCQPSQDEARQALTDPELYRRAIDAWSMRDFTPANSGNSESGHDHFFDTFAKFGPAVEGHLSPILAEITRRAADGNVQYLELMLSPDHGRASALGSQLGYDPDLPAMRAKLLAAGFDDIVAQSRKNLDEMEQGKKAELHCASDPEIHGGACSVHIRYIYPVLRANKPAQVFAQILMGFELASHDPRVVAINLVQPEDWYVPMHDFHLHMQMVSYVKSLYPNVHVTLHAGELKPGIVPPSGLRTHIRESIELGRAERIGHGVDVMYEDNPHELLTMMARRNVMVEICLTSNEAILGVQGKKHPLAMYLKAGVPVALTTDDEGVSRTEMTREYERAVLDQGLDYVTLKKMARTSLEHAFLPGFSLWSDTHKFAMVRECAGDKPTSVPAPPCMKFLNGSEKAREQWRLERHLTEFESKF